MKKAEDILNEVYHSYEHRMADYPYHANYNAIINCIKQAQKDAIKASLKMASEEVCLNYGDCIVVDTDSILDCEKKLLKQIK
jgi:hypothetical protein